MVRGCQKKIIYLKNTHSSIFDEAYLVIRDNLMYENISECDMVKEATRILDESFAYDETPIKQKVKFFLKKNIIPFLVGSVIGVLITALILK